MDQPILPEQQNPAPALYRYHTGTLITIGVLAISSGVLYWDTNKEPGLRYQGYLKNSTLAPFSPIFPVSAQLGGSLTNAFFNYVAFLDLAQQFRDPITHAYSKHCNRFNWVAHWLTSVLLGFFTTLPQWSIGLDGTAKNDIPETVSSLLNCFVNIQGASCLLKAVWNLPWKKARDQNQTQIRQKKMQSIQSAYLDEDQTKALLTAPHFLEQIEVTTVEAPYKFTCAKKAGISTVVGLLGLLGLWMNVGICMQAYTATDMFLNKIGLPSPESVKLTSVAFNIICSLGYYLLCIKSLINSLKSFCSPSSLSAEKETTVMKFNFPGREKSIQLSSLFTASACLIACISLLSGFTVDQMTYDSFDTLPTQWRFTLSFLANLGTSLCYNMFQSIRLPNELFKAILPLLSGEQYQRIREHYQLNLRCDREMSRQPERTALLTDLEEASSRPLTYGS